MITFSARHLSWCIAGLILPFAASLTVAGDEEQEMRYLFAGMLQERSKLKSWSCEMMGMDPENLSYDMKYLSNGESVRFSRTLHHSAYDGETFVGVDKKGKLIKSGKVVHLPKRDEIYRACDNKQMNVYWNVSSHECVISKSTPSQRWLLHLWDPRMAGLILKHDETDYREAINSRLKFWRQAAFKIEHKSALWTVTATTPYEWQDIRLSFTVDTEHGFTLVYYRGDALYKANSKFPGKVEVYYEATAKWKQLDGVWVPIHHRHVKGDGTVVREYKISWDWINKDINDKEFTIDALSVPNDVRKIYHDENLQEIPQNKPLATERHTRLRGNRPWIRWVGYSLGFLLIALALLRYRPRKKPNNSA